VMFNRFSRDARRCVEAALEEARLLGHDSVGDEDLLLGVLSGGEGAAAEALSSSGVALEAAREECEGLFADALASVGISFEEIRRGAGERFEMRLPNDRRIPFSPRAKKALERALREAIRLGDNRIMGEHVLLGTLRDENGTAARVLANLGVTVVALENRLDRLRGRAASR
jgi:ATP-dependent Clp protease ATP-binding subunit ClpC